jgi:hypothetical protein
LIIKQLQASFQTLFCSCFFHLHHNLHHNSIAETCGYIDGVVYGNYVILGNDIKSLTYGRIEKR